MQMASLTRYLRRNPLQERLTRLFSATMQPKNTVTDPQITTARTMATAAKTGGTGFDAEVMALYRIVNVNLGEPGWRRSPSFILLSRTACLPTTR